MHASLAFTLPEDSRKRVKVFRRLVVEQLPNLHYLHMLVGPVRVVRILVVYNCVKRRRKGYVGRRAGILLKLIGIIIYTCWRGKVPFVVISSVLLHILSSLRPAGLLAEPSGRPREARSPANGAARRLRRRCLLRRPRPRIPRRPANAAGGHQR